MKNTHAAMLAPVAVAMIAGVASANIDYVIERGGNSWSLGGDLRAALVGFADVEVDTVSRTDVLGHIASGADRVIGLGNGVSNLGSSLDNSSGDAVYESTEFFNEQFAFLSGDKLPFSNGIDPFTGVDLGTDASGRFNSVFFLVFEAGGNVVLNGGIGGTATINGRGSLGVFPASLNPGVPTPGTAALLGLGGLAIARRRR